MANRNKQHYARPVSQNISIPMFWRAAYFNKLRKSTGYDITRILLGKPLIILTRSLEGEIRNSVQIPVLLIKELRPGMVWSS